MSILITTPQVLTLSAVLLLARAAHVTHPQYDEAYFAQYDREATVVKASRLGFYSVGELVAASRPEWCQEANYGKGAFCVSCITASGHAFSCPVDHLSGV